MALFPVHKRGVLIIFVAMLGGLPHVPAADCNGNGAEDAVDLAPRDFGFKAVRRLGWWGAGALTVGDFNGDSILDLVTVNNPCPGCNGCTRGPPSTLSIFLRTGGEAVEAPQVKTVGDYPRPPEAADLDGDGDLDLVWTERWRYQNRFRVQVLWNTGGGVFQEPADLALEDEETVRDVTAADLDLDGTVDLVASGETRILLYFNRGDGTFAPPAPPIEGRADETLASDLDADGDPDLARAGEAGVSVLLNAGGGSFGEPVSYAVADQAGNLTAADFDGDLKRDLAANSGAGAISIFHGNGDGTFQAAQEFAFLFLLAADDLDGDGRADLVTGHGGDPCNGIEGRVRIHRNHGDGTFEPPIEQVVDVFGRVSVTAADLDADGDKDLAVAAGDVWLFMNGGEGTFPVSPVIPLEGNQISLAAADLDGDGKTDLAATVPFGVVTLRNDGTGALTVHSTLPVGSNPIALVAGDVDGDGERDLVTANSLPDDLLPDNVSVIINRGGGSFSPPRNYAIPNAPACIALGDLDGDGDLDVVVGNGGFDQFPHVEYPRNAWPRNVWVLANRGDGRLEGAVGHSVLGDPVSVATGDLDGDGDNDVATANSLLETGVVSVLVNAGDGTFREPTEYSMGKEPVSIATADLDGNGDLDLAMADAFNGNVSVLLNDGNGSFGAVHEHPLANPPASALAGDLDGDGDPDLTTAGDRGVTVLLNDGDGRSFRTPAGYGRSTIRSPFLTLVSGRALASTDLDGDGLLDLVVSVPGGIEILINQTVPPASVDLDRNGIPDECDGPSFHRGDPNDDGEVNLSDGISILSFLFREGAPPGCLEVADANDDGRIDVSDGVALLNFLFLGGAPPADPGPPGAPCGHGKDPLGSPGNLGCTSYAHCKEP